MTNHELLELLYEALNATNEAGEQLGIIVREENGKVTPLRQRLYAMRRENPDLHCLSINASPTDPDHEFYIVRSEPDGKNG